MDGQRHTPSYLPQGKTRYPLWGRLGGPQGLSGRVRKTSSRTGIRSPDRPVCSKSLYRLRYPGPPSSRVRTQEIQKKCFPSSWWGVVQLGLELSVRLQVINLNLSHSENFWYIWDKSVLFPTYQCRRYMKPYIRQLLCIGEKLGVSPSRDEYTECLMYLEPQGDGGSLLFACVQRKHSAPRMPLTKEEIVDIILLIGSRSARGRERDRLLRNCRRPDRAKLSITLRRFVVCSLQGSGSCHVG